MPTIVEHCPTASVAHTYSQKTISSCITKLDYSDKYLSDKIFRKTKQNRIVVQICGIVFKLDSEPQDFNIFLSHITNVSDKQQPILGF